MVMGSGPVVTLVLLTLVIFSFTCWTIILVKVFRFRQASSLDSEFGRLFNAGGSFEDVANAAGDMSGSPMAAVFEAGYMELERLHSEFSRASAHVPLGVWLETLERSLDNAVQTEVAGLSSRIPVLATIGNAAPFIGLFGTVWGIMSSFQSIGIKGSASLATVAPGISEALVATAAGLAAAIPAVMAFNTFMNMLDDLERRLRGFSSDFLNSVERRLAVKGRGRK
jgi:biopolymer transport protein TolQ